MSWPYANFTEKELAVCPCCGEYNLDRDFAETLQMARDLFGYAMNVTSGYRCSLHNKAVGGSITSSHLKACAADIALPTALYASQIYRCSLTA